jgi:hypothetical protein
MTINKHFSLSHMSNRTSEKISIENTKTYFIQIPSYYKYIKRTNYHSSPYCNITVMVANNMVVGLDKYTTNGKNLDLNNQRSVCGDYSCSLCNIKS